MSDSENAEGDGPSSARLAESKSDSKKKLIRLLTVMAYVSSVSTAAVMLSMYYIFLWEPKVPEHHLRADPNGPLALRQDLHFDVGDAEPSPWFHPGFPAVHSQPQHQYGDPGILWARPPPPPQHPPPESRNLVQESRRPSLLVQRIITSSPIRAARTPSTTSTLSTPSTTSTLSTPSTTSTLSAMSTTSTPSESSTSPLTPSKPTSSPEPLRESPIARTSSSTRLAETSSARASESTTPSSSSDPVIQWLSSSVTGESPTTTAGV